MIGKDLLALQKASEYILLKEKHDDLHDLSTPNAAERAESVYGEEPPDTGTLDLHRDDDDDYERTYLEIDKQEEIVDSLHDSLKQYMDSKFRDHEPDYDDFEDAVDEIIEILKAELIKKI